MYFCPLGKQFQNSLLPEAIKLRIQLGEEKVLHEGMGNPLDTCHFWDAHKGVTSEKQKKEIELLTIYMYIIYRLSRLHWALHLHNDVVALSHARYLESLGDFSLLTETGKGAPGLQQIHLELKHSKALLFNFRVVCRYNLRMWKYIAKIPRTLVLEVWGSRRAGQRGHSPQLLLPWTRCHSRGLNSKSPLLSLLWLWPGWDKLPTEVT